MTFAYLQFNPASALPEFCHLVFLEKINTEFDSELCFDPEFDSPERILLHRQINNESGSNAWFTFCNNEAIVVFGNFFAD
jgi:hypothetical protein